MVLPVIQNKVSLPLSTIKAVIGIAAGKGGVGKSTVTVNLALALKEKGCRVGILDADLYGPSIRKMLPEDKLPTQKGQVIQPAVCQGIKIVSISYFRKESEATAVRAPIANGLIQQFIQNVDWGELDFLLIDFPPGTGDIQITLSQKANLLGAVIVTTPQEVALLDVRKSISLFELVKVPLLGVVENMSYFKPADNCEPLYPFGRGGGEKLAAEFTMPILGKLPLDPILCICGDKGESLFNRDPQKQLEISQAFLRLADEFCQQVELLKVEMERGAGSFELIWKDKP